MQNKKVIVTLPSGEKVVSGHLLGATFYKKVRKELHLFRSPEAWAIDHATFKWLEGRAELIVITDESSRVNYKISYERAMEASFLRTYEQQGKQIFILIGAFTKEKMPVTAQQLKTKFINQ